MRENQIQVLSDIEHVLKRPQMYVGSTSWNDSEEFVYEDGKIYKKEVSFVPAFVTLFKEIVSNSIDEFVRTGGEYSTQISVRVEDDSIIVEDTGRGISNQTINVDGEELPQSVTAFTRLKAGSNFGNDGSTIGMNGVGAACTNVFSRRFLVSTETEDGEKTTLECMDNLSRFTYKTHKTKGNRNGTKIQYYPDFTRLGMDQIDQVHSNMIQKTLFEYSICYPGITFKYNGKKVQTSTFKKYVQLYSDTFECFSFDNVDIGVFSGDHDQVSFVNGIYTKRGGTHIPYCLNGVCSRVREMVSKKYKEIKPGDVKNKLIFIINIRGMKNPRFDSQTKEQLSNSNRDLGPLFQDVDWDGIAKKIYRNTELMFPILESFKIKEEMKKRKELKNKEKKVQKKKIPKLIEANHPKVEERVLYITEGQSALSSLISVREKYEGGYPLKGKVISPQDTPPEKLMKNQEISDILSALGLRLTSQSISELQYGKVVIMTDQDEDGHGIATTLINLFYTYWPDLIRQGRLFKAVSPIIIGKNKKTGKKKEFYSLTQFQNDPNFWNYVVEEHNKGLGSLSLKQYRKMMNTLIRVEEDEESRSRLDMAFGQDSGKRKEWLIG